MDSVNYDPFVSSYGQSHTSVDPGEQQGNANISFIGPPDTNCWVETATPNGKVYYYHAQTRQTVWERPTSGPVVTYQEFILRSKQGQMSNVAASSAPNQLADQNRELAARVAQQPLSLPIAGAVGAIGMNMMEAGKAPATVQPKWLEYFTEDGRPYYYNSATGETSWTKPPTETTKNGMAASNFVQTSASQLDGTDGSAVAMDAEKVAGHEDSKRPTAEGASLEEPKPMVQAAQKTDPSKPISSNPVAGTAWCVVWTGDYRVFFFNPTTRTSVWERPPELYGRPDVDLLLSKPPEPKKAAEKRGPPASSPVETAAEEGVEEQFETTTATDTAADREMPSKKKRKKAAAAAAAAAADAERQAESKGAVVENVTPTPKPKDGAFEAELKAAQERAQIPLETRTSQFKAMLHEKDVSPFSTWEKELHKIVFDPRYLLLTSKERKEAFEEYVKERADQERAERKRKYKEAKDGYQQLMEEAKLNHKSVFVDFVETWGKDARFKAIEKGRDRESLFDDHVRSLRLKKREEEQALAAKQKEEFLELLKEQSGARKKSRWSEVRKTINHDTRYRQVDSATREEWFREYCKTLPSENSDDEEEEARKERLKQKERKLREELAQKAREKEVAAELESQLKERNREMEKHLTQEAEDNFKALLVDLIKSTDQTWKDCKRRLRKDNRWESADLLDRQRKEQLFEEHISQLESKYRAAFIQLLEETSSIDLSCSWKEAKKIIRKDPRYVRYAVSERKCERLFKDMIRERLNQAKANFMDLLKETKVISAKSKQLLQEGEEHLKEILSVLENDKRYLKLESVAREREKLLESYLETLAEDADK